MDLAPDRKRGLAYALQAVQADQMDRGPIRYPSYGDDADREQLRKARAIERQGLDLKAAARLYKPLARLGVTEAMRRLAELPCTSSEVRKEWQERARREGDPISLENKVTMAALVAAGDPAYAGPLSYYYAEQRKKYPNFADTYLSLIYSHAQEELYREQARAGSPEAMYWLFGNLYNSLGDTDTPRAREGFAWGQKALSLGYGPMLASAAAEDDERIFGFSRAQRRSLAMQAQTVGVDWAKNITGLMELQDQQEREFRAIREEYQRRQAAASGTSFAFDTYSAPEPQWPEYIYDDQTRESYYVHRPVDKYGEAAWIDRDGGMVSIFRSTVPNRYYDRNGRNYYEI